MYFDSVRFGQSFGSLLPIESHNSPDSLSDGLLAGDDHVIHVTSPQEVSAAARLTARRWSLSQCL